MMIVKLDSDVYRISFHHSHVNEKKVSGRTYCTIHLLESADGKLDVPAIICMGCAVCFRPDIYNKAVGRRVSLGRALFIADFDRADRTEFWKSYRAACSDFK